MNLRQLILLISFYFFSVVSMHSQQLYPGDVNNNGEVNHIDMLYLGLANNAIGPPRIDQGTSWQPYNFTSWGTTFPNGLDYAYADCDGNGIIDFNDFLVIEQNYGLQHGSVTPETFQSGTTGVDAQLGFDSSGIFNPFFQAEVVFVPITLGTQQLPANDFYGISFTIEFDPEVFCTDICMIDFGFFDIWVDTTGFNSFTSYNFKDNDPETGEMEVTLVRNDQQAIAGGEGIIGAFVGIIEEDLIDLYNATETTTLIKLNKIKYIDENFNESPVVKDSINIQIIDPDSLLNSEENLESSKIEIFPNPISETIYIRSKDIEIQEFQLLDTQGRTILQSTQSSTSDLSEYSIGNISSGIYYVKLLTEQGVIIEKVVVQKS